MILAILYINERIFWIKPKTISTKRNLQRVSEFLYARKIFRRLKSTWTWTYCTTSIHWTIFIYTLSVSDKMTENTFLLPLPIFSNSLNELTEFLVLLIHMTIIVLCLLFDQKRAASFLLVPYNEYLMFTSLFLLQGFFLCNTTKTDDRNQNRG